MAVRFQIYIRDVLVDQDHYNDRRTETEISELLKTIVPTTTFTRVHQTRQGFIVTFNNDSDLNLFYEPLIINSLKEKHLAASLASETQELRQAVFLGLTNEVYSKPNTDLETEIVQKIAVPCKILHLHKYRSYLFITFDSCSVTEDIISKGSIDLFSTDCTVQKPLPKRKPTHHQTHQHQRTNLPYGRPPPSVNRTPLPIWPALRNNQHQGHPVHLNSNTTISGSSDFDYKAFVEVASKISEAISNGMENP